MVGQIILYAGATPDVTKFLFCDGSAISRATYSGLFTAISTAYGIGDGITTFNIPDMQGRVPAGLAGVGGNATVTTLGNNDGIALASRQPKHRHTVTDPTHSHVQNVNANTGGVGPITNMQRTTEQGFTASLLTTVAASTGITVGTASAALDAPAYEVVGYWIAFA